MGRRSPLMAIHGGGPLLFDSVTWISALVCAGPFALLLASGALVSIWRSNRQRTAKSGWSLVVLALPLLVTLGGRQFAPAGHCSRKSGHRAFALLRVQDQL